MVMNRSRPGSHARNDSVWLLIEEDSQTTASETTQRAYLLSRTSSIVRDIENDDLVHVLDEKMVV